MDGGVYEYSIMNEGARVSDFVDKRTNFNCVAAAFAPGSSPVLDGGVSSPNLQFAVGSDKMLREISNSTLVAQHDTGAALSQIVLASSGKALFAIASDA